MSKNCDGVEHKENTASTENGSPDVGVRSSRDNSPKEFPSESNFRGFTPVPHVRLERFNITPFLNGHKSSIHKRINRIGGKNVEIHLKRATRKCVVRLKQDDLEKLKASIKKKHSENSDSEASNSTDMAVRCKICEKTYSSEKKLLNHVENKHIIYKSEDRKPQKRVSFSDHVIVHEVKEYHKCRKCPKIFEEYQSLRAHMKNEHKKRKCYICHYCNKKFVDRMFFKVHIKLHCDVCSKLYPNKTKYVEHRRISCRVIKLHKCKTCDESFFRIMDLKDHSYEHDNFLYVCDVCKDKFTNKCEIAHHCAFLHSQKRPNELYTMRKVGMERLYLCNFCDISSVERDVIESHIQKLPDLMNKAMTGYKDFYFCDQCMQKFDTEKAMLQHKWTHFLKIDNETLKDIPTKPQAKIKTTYNVTEKIPENMQPVLVLEKLDNVYPMQFMKPIDKSSEALQVVDLNKLKKKAVVDPIRRKTLISKYQCLTCEKYFSNNYCLSRHIKTQHEDFENLRCKVCEESFVWPSLLKSHKCIRLNHPEMPFDDARPEIHFDNLPQNGFDDLNLNIEDNEDYLNRVDFEIPAPIVELRECDSTFNVTNSVVQNSFVNEKDGVSSSGYRLLIQEVPIEF